MKETRTKAKEKLAKMRKVKGLTQKEIASKVCMDDSTYSKRESGKLKIDIKQWEKLAEILECNISDIFEEDVNQSIIFNDNSTGYYCANNIFTIHEDLLEMQNKIHKKMLDELEATKKENVYLKRLVKELKNNKDS